jgi:hypothetical protein
MNPQRLFDDDSEESRVAFDWNGTSNQGTNTNTHNGHGAGTKRPMSPRR